LTVPGAANRITGLAQVRHGLTLRGALLCVVLVTASACHQTGKEPPVASSAAAVAADPAPRPAVNQAPPTPVSVDETPQTQPRSDNLPPTPVNPEPQPQAVVDVDEPQDKSEADATAIVDTSSNGQAAASVAPDPPPPPKPEPELLPSSLIGAGKGDLIARLGVPGLLRREPPAEFWQFAGDGCVLHVYLYENTADRLYQVTHVELLPRGGLDAVPSGCFRRLFRDRPQSSG